MEEPTAKEFGLQISSARRQIRHDRYSKGHGEDIQLFLPEVKGQNSAQKTQREEAGDEIELNNRFSIQQFEIGEEKVQRKGKQLWGDPTSSTNKSKKQFTGNSQAIIIEQLRQSITNGSITEYVDVRQHGHLHQQNHPCAYGA